MPKQHPIPLYLLFCLLFNCCLGIPLISFAQSPRYDVHHFSTDDGLSDNRVYSILGHSNGFVWIGTRKGLDRFDGYQFVSIDLPKRDYKNFDGGKDATIKKLFELKDGRILIQYDVFVVKSEHFYADIYDPVNKTFEAIDLEEAVFSLAEVQLKNGRRIPYVENRILSDKRVTTIFDAFGNKFIFDGSQHQYQPNCILAQGSN